ncbi:hypothetical protein FRC17_007457 [Serendipita sp. 399]|nr:hypothetical protein FRC17_007457 [Serendipita sp. 399]
MSARQRSTDVAKRVVCKKTESNFATDDVLLIGKQLNESVHYGLEVVGVNLTTCTIAKIFAGALWFATYAHHIVLRVTIFILSRPLNTYAARHIAATKIANWVSAR